LSGNYFQVEINWTSRIGTSFKRQKKFFYLLKLDHGEKRKMFFSLNRELAALLGRIKKKGRGSCLI